MASRIILSLSALAAAMMLASCGSGTESGTTTLSLGLSDAPVDGAKAVVVKVQGVHMHSPGGDDVIYQYCDDPAAETTVEPDTEPANDRPASSGETETAQDDDPEVEEDTMQAESEPGCESPVSRPIDLMALTDGRSVQLLDGISVEPGKYPWVRLIIDESDPGHIELLDGAVEPLSIPSGAQTGLKLNKGFTATINGDNRFMIDFDLRKSVQLNSQGYKLRPTLRMVKLENAAEQRLTGTWLKDDMPKICESPMAYVYAGVDDVVPDDMDGENTNPVVEANFVADGDGTSFSYQVDYIAFGEYTVAYTCDGKLDRAGSDDNLTFGLPITVTVGTTEADETVETVDENV